MKNNVEFGAIVEMVRAGGTVEDERLLDAWAYASDGFNEIYRLCKSLMDGFREQARAMRKMNAIIEEKNRQIDEKNRIIWVLNRKLQAETERTEGRETTSSGAYAPPSPQGEGFTRDEGRGDGPSRTPAPTETKDAGRGRPFHRAAVPLPCNE